MTPSSAPHTQHVTPQNTYSNPSLTSAVCLAILTEGQRRVPSSSGISCTRRTGFALTVRIAIRPNQARMGSVKSYRTVDALSAPLCWPGAGIRPQRLTRTFTSGGEQDGKVPKEFPPWMLSFLNSNEATRENETSKLGVLGCLGTWPLLRIRHCTLNIRQLN
jgi:hypothetical protein